jgi:O-antigen/teichoic acid export membrane protein
VTLSDEYTAFWIGIGTGILASGCIWISGPYIATFYGQPEITPLMKVISLGTLILSIGSMPNILLTRKLEFRTLAKVGAIATAVSGSVAIGLAISGCGVWALALQYLVSAAVSTSLLWLWTPWRPAFKLNFDAAKGLFSASSYLILCQVTYGVSSRLHTIIIGRFFGLTELGFYNRAEGMQQLPVGSLSGIIARVALPVFAAASGDTDRLRRGLKTSLTTVAFVTIPTMIGLSALAEPIITVLFGTPWMPAAHLLQVLALAGVFWPFHVLNVQALLAQGHSKLLFKIDITKALAFVLVVACLAPFGLYAIAWGQVIISALALIINSFYSGSMLNYGAVQQLRDNLPVFILSIVMGYTVYYLNYNLSLSPVLSIALLVPFGASLFMVFAYFLRFRAFREAVPILRDFWPLATRLETAQGR